MFNFIQIVENLSEEIEDTIERAERAMQVAESQLESARQRKAEVMETLKEVARGGEPEVDRLWITDSEGNQTDLYVAFEKAIEAEGQDEVQKAVEAHLEGLEETEIDRLERENPHHLDADYPESDWE